MNDDDHRDRLRQRVKEARTLLELANLEPTLKAIVEASMDTHDPDSPHSNLADDLQSFGLTDLVGFVEFATRTAAPLIVEKVRMTASADLERLTAAQLVASGFVEGVLIGLKAGRKMEVRP